MKHILFQTVSALILIFVFIVDVQALSEKEYLQTRDSLQQILNQSSGIERADALFELVRFIAPYETESCDTLIWEEMELAKSLDYKTGIANAYQNLGSVFYQKNKMSESLENYFHAIEIYEENKNYLQAGSCYSAVGILFYFTGNFNKTHQYLINAIEVQKKIKNRTAIAINYYLLGYYYITDVINPQKAKQYLFEAMKLGKEIPLHDFYISGFYSSLSVSYKNERKLDSAIYSLRIAISLLNGENDDVHLNKTIDWASLGGLFEMKGETDSALFYYNKSLEMAEHLNYLFTVPKCAIGIANILLSKNRRMEALNYYGQAIESAEKTNSSGNFYADPSKKYTSEWKLDAWPGYTKVFSKNAKKLWAKKNLKYMYFKLSNLYKEFGQTEKAFEYFELYHAYSDSLHQIEKARELFNLELDYETEIKNRQIENLSQENESKAFKLKQSFWLLFGAAVLVILVIMMAIILVHQNRLKNSQQTLLLQQRLFRVQMNPHFLFNSLASIQNFIIKKNPSEASDYLSKFSRLMREILNSSDNEYVPLDEEIDAIENYLSLQKIRYEDMFEYSIEQDEDIDTEIISIPPMLAQPFIENAIEHGIKHKESKGTVNVRLKQKSDYISLEIEDDGVGRKKAKGLEQPEKKDHKSMATTITKDRLANLNKKLKQKISFEIIDLKDAAGNATGTKVVFEIPCSL